MLMAEMFSQLILSVGWLVCSHMEFNNKRAQGKEVNVNIQRLSALIRSSYKTGLHERGLFKSNDQEHDLS